MTEEEWIAQHIARAPKLTSSQKDRIALLLRTSDSSERDAA